MAIEVKMIVRDISLDRDFRDEEERAKKPKPLAATVELVSMLEGSDSTEFYVPVPVELARSLKVGDKAKISVEFGD